MFPSPTGRPLRLSITAAAELKLEGWTDKQYRFRKTKEEVKMILELDGYSTRKYEGKWNG